MWIIELAIKIFLWITIFTFILNQYERLNYPDDNEGFDFMLIFSFIWEIVADVVIWVLYFVGFYNFDTKIISKEKEFPIVFIPGYTMNRGYFFLYAKGLQKRGYNVFVFSPKKIFDSISDIAMQLEYKVDEVLKETGKDKVILVGHSMGGLLARYYTQRLSGKPHVVKIITIGTPHFGTKLSPFGYGKNARDMEVNSKFLSDLNKDVDELQKNVKLLSILSKSDNLVIPYQNSILPNFEKYIVDHLGHNSLMISSEIYGKIVNELEKTEFEFKNEQK